MQPYTPTDIAIPKSYAHPEKFDELFIHLRKENPIPWVESNLYRPFWAITKAVDFVEVLSKPQIFSSEQPLLQPKAWEEERLKKYGRLTFNRSLLQMDPPDHTAYRSILQPWFSPANVLTRKRECAAIAKEYMNILAAQNGECEYVSTIAKRFPLRMIMMFLKLPMEDEKLLLDLTSKIFAPEDPDIIKNPQRSDVQTESQQEFRNYFKEFVEQRKTHPQDDLSSHIANAKINGQPMPADEQLSIFTSLASAGHETSGAVISGSMLVFAQYPELLEQLKRQPTLIPRAVEELFRWICPPKISTRTALEDYKIRDRVIKKGDRIAVCFQSVNRDEELIEDPFRIRFDREPNRHLTFGSGPHMCLGMSLARLEITTLLEELVPRLESVELNGEFSYVQAFQVSGLKKLPIRFKMR